MAAYFDLDIVGLPSAKGNLQRARAENLPPNWRNSYRYDARNRMPHMNSK